MSKIYIVTNGDYSDYRIVAVFSTKAKAEVYRQEGNYDSVEPYEVDAEDDKILRPLFMCLLDVETGSLIEQTNQSPEMALPSDRGRWHITTEAYYNRGRETVVAMAYDSCEHALKLATDARQAKLREIST